MRRTRVAFVPLLAMLLLVGACSAPLLRSEPEAALAASGEYRLIPGLDVPRVEGPAGCGAQALATVMAWHDPAVDSGDLAAELPWQALGATPVDLLLGARDRGYAARVARGTIDAIDEQIAAGRPVLVMIDSALRVRRLPMPTFMHWAVVSGCALDGSSVLLAAEARRHHVVGREDFLRRWEPSDCCMIVVEAGGPGPASAGPQRPAHGGAGVDGGSVEDGDG